MSETILSTDQPPDSETYLSDGTVPELPRIIREFARLCRGETVDTPLNFRLYRMFPYFRFTEESMRYTTPGVQEEVRRCLGGPMFQLVEPIVCDSPLIVEGS